MTLNTRKKNIVKLMIFVFLVNLFSQLNLFVNAKALSLSSVSTLPASQEINDVTFGNNVFIGVGYYGYILRSTDGINWTVVNNYTDGLFFSGAAYGNSTFVATGSDGTIYYSKDDGLTWLQATSGTTKGLGNVKFYNNNFVVTGSDSSTGSYKSIVLTSPDGVTWTKKVDNYNGLLQKITYSGTLYAAGSNSGNVLTSTDLVTWTSRALPGANSFVNHVTYENDRFLATDIMGVTYSSTTGTSWSATTNQIPSVDQPFNGAYLNGKYILTGNSGGIYTSTNASTWTRSNSNSTSPIYSITYGNGIYLASGNNGIIMSTDGTNWKYVMTNFSSVAYDGSKYVAIGYTGSDGTIFKSTDFTNWTNATPSLLKSLNGIAYGNGKFVAVGSTNGTGGTIVTSTDGNTWSSTNSSFNEDLYGIAYGSSNFVSISNSNRIVISSNGTTWTSKYLNTDYYLSGVSYANNTFVIMGNKAHYDVDWNYIVDKDVLCTSSDDGLTWNVTESTPKNVSLNSVAYGGGKYIAVGSDNSTGNVSIYQSSDLTNWTAVTLSSPPAGSLSNVQYKNGNFLAIGSSGVLATSSDGASWTFQSVGSNYTLSSMVFNSGNFYIVGPDFLRLTATAALPKEITDYTALSDVNLNADEHLIDLAALKASGKLPTKVTVTDGTTPADATITDWTGTFDGTTTGTKTLTAVWTMPSGYVDTTSPITVTITVNVNTVQTPPPKEITGYTALTDIDLNADEHLVDLAALKASGKLPTKVTVTDGTTPTDATITNWTSSFDGTATGAKTLTAVWTMPSGYADITSPITVTIKVNVNTVQTLPPKEITNYTTLSSVNLNADEHLIDLAALKASGKLPTKVTVTDGTTPTDATITDWTGTFDGTTTGAKTLTAVWTMPSGYVDTTSPITVTITVNVNTVQTPPPKEITSYTALTDIDLNTDEHLVDLAALKASGKLPTKVTVTDGTTPTDATITDWTSSFDGTTGGAKTLTAVWTMPSGYGDITSPITVTVIVNVNTIQTQLPTINTLSALTISSGSLTPSFASNTTNYTVNVGNSVTSITLTPTATDSDSTIKINGTLVANATTSSAISLNVGSNSINIEVKAQSGAVKTYTVTIIRAAAASTINSLSALTVSSGVLTPSFSSSVTSYAVNVGNGITSINLKPTAADITSTIKINGTLIESGTTSSAISLNVGQNPISVVVTSQSGAVKTYTVTVTREAAASTINSLSALTVSSGTLTPSFDSSITNYVVNVANGITSINLKPTAADSTSTIKINGISIVSGTTSSAISLNVGANSINIEVKAQSGTTKTYTVTVNRASAVINVTDISLDFVSKTMLINDTFKLNATLTPTNATNKSVIWTSSNPSVATVDDTGLITANSIGFTTITVKSVDGNIIASCTVEVKTIPLATVDTSIISAAISAASSSGSNIVSLPKAADADTNKLLAIPSAALIQLTNANVGLGVTIGEKQIQLPSSVINPATYGLSNDNSLQLSCTDLESVDAETKLASKSTQLRSVDTPFDVNLNLVDSYGVKTPVHSFNGSTVTITMQLTAQDIQGKDTSKLAIYYWNPVSRLWELIGGSYNPANMKFAFTTHHFSVFTLMDSPPAVPVTGVTLDKTSVTLNIGQTSKLTETILPSNATTKAVTWSSSNSSIASVDNTGLVTAIGEGTAVITVRTADGGYTASSSITAAANAVSGSSGGGGGAGSLTINTLIKVTGVTIDSIEKALNVGDTAALNITVAPVDASNKAVKWTSSDDTIVKVDSNGKITAISEGTAIITVTTLDGNYTVSCKITVSTKKVEENAPILTFVGIEHSPLIEGDTETFYLTSINRAKVQYRMFLISDETGKTEEITNEYTAIVDGNVPYKLSLDKKFELGHYRLMTWVRGEGSKADYDSTYTAYLNCVNRDDTNRVYANGSMEMEKDSFKLGETVKVTGIKDLSGIPGPYKYRLHIYNATTDKWTKNVTEYADNIEWKPTEPGVYVLDVHVNTESSTTWSKYLNNPNSEDVYGTYEAWKLKVVTVNP